MSSNYSEVAPSGWSGTVNAMKKHKEIDNHYALAWYMKNKGYKHHHKPEKKKKDESVFKTKSFIEWLSAKYR